MLGGNVVAILAVVIVMPPALIDTIALSMIRMMIRQSILLHPTQLTHSLTQMMAAMMGKILSHCWTMNNWKTLMKKF
jgi:hypothetical protein